MIGTKTWWKQQFALVVTMIGLLLMAVNGYFFVERGGSAKLLLALAGLLLAFVGGRAWRHYSSRYTAEQIEQNLFGPD